MESASTNPAELSEMAAENWKTSPVLGVNVGPTTSLSFWYQEIQL